MPASISLKSYDAGAVIVGGTGAERKVTVKPVAFGGTMRLLASFSSDYSVGSRFEFPIDAVGGVFGGTATATELSLRDLRLAVAVHRDRVGVSVDRGDRVRSGSGGQRNVVDVHADGDGNGSAHTARSG